MGAQDFERRFIGRNTEHFARGNELDVERFWFEVLVQRRLERLEMDAAFRSVRGRQANGLCQALGSAAIDMSVRHRDRENPFRIEAHAALLTLVRKMREQLFGATNIGQVGKERRRP